MKKISILEFKLRIMRYLLFFILPLFGLAQKGNVFSSTADKAKIELAKQKMYSGQYLSAINSLKEIAKSSPNDPNVHHYIGASYFALNRNEDAKEYLNKAISLNPDKGASHFLLGRLYQSEEEYDKAIEEFNLSNKDGKSDDEDSQDASTFLSQCNMAKKLTNSPVDVNVMNAGKLINSEFDDKNPCMTADGKTLVFTTRRPDGTNAIKDETGDGKYFEDVYITEIDTATKDFGEAKPVPGSINTKAHDAVTSISPDGKQIFLYKNDINDKASRGGDIFVSKVGNNKWRTPNPFGKPVASSYWEGGACISPDGKMLIFTSERKGGFGGSDIWMVKKISRKEWGKPENLGKMVNTAYDEGGVFLAPDGKTLFFCSNGPNSMGSYDIFKTVYENNKWSEPVNLGYPINSSSKEGQLTISANGKYAYFSSSRPGGIGESDIYKVDLKDYAILEKDNKVKKNDGLSIVRGTMLDGYEGFGISGVEVTIFDTEDNEVASTSTNENGEYFLTLKGGKSYKILVKKKGFKDIAENFDLKLGEEDTFILEKGYLLKK